VGKEDRRAKSEHSEIPMETTKTTTMTTIKTTTARTTAEATKTSREHHEREQ
jgi:hypothetical protein